MGTKSKLFRVFVAGATISDGRQITPEMINEIVETFNSDTYTPRVNVEHIAGFSPEPPFNGYGDVVAVEARDDDVTIAGKTEKRRALYAQVDANDQLMALVAGDQKPFPSVEITGSYAGTGKVGLVGLAFTDNPASIATQRLKFSVHAPGTVIAHGESPATIEFEQRPADPTSITAAITAGFAAVAGMFKRDEPKRTPADPVAPANDNFDPAAFATAMGETMATQLTKAMQPLVETQAKFRTDFDALVVTLGSTEAPRGPQRALSTGGDAAIVTDC